LFDDASFLKESREDLLALFDYGEQSIRARYYNIKIPTNTIKAITTNVELFTLNKHFADPAVQRRVLFVKNSEKDILYNHTHTTHTANLLKQKLENCFDPLEREILVKEMNSCINKLNLKKRNDLYNATYNKELKFRPL